MAEQGITEPVLGLALDGLGLGPDSQLWGGELLLVEGLQYRRLSHLPLLALPGGDRAASEPWRSAAAVLHRLGRTDEIASRFAQPAAKTVQQMLQQNFNCPHTSSSGRLFDAVASLLGICHTNSFEADAAMQLEASAYRYLQRHSLQDENSMIYFSESGQPVLDRLLTCIADSGDPELGAARFHHQLIDGLSRWVIGQSQTTKVNSVVLGGGCFLNQLLLQGVTETLRVAGMTVYSASELPCNDAGISLGQAQIAHWLAMQNKNDK